MACLLPCASGMCKRGDVRKNACVTGRNSTPMISLRQKFAPIIDFAFPPRCPACGDEVVGAPGQDDALCPSCWSRLEMPGHPSCRLCQHPLAPEGNLDDGLCVACREAAPVHDGMSAATIYGDASRDVVLALKHAGRFALAGPMGRLMAMRLEASGAVLPPDPLVVPVPLHRTRLWSRGYNQSVLLARGLAKARGWSVAPDALRRVRRTRALGGLDRSERLEMLAGAIVVPHALSVAGRDIVLVDDVVTSGATTDACVRALKDAGADRVVVSCYARVRSPWRAGALRD